MKLAVHICSFNGKDYQKRFIYLKKIVKNYFAISKKIKIFIHTNKISEKYKIKNIEYIAHDLKNENPFYLSWKCRSLIEKQKMKFDYFIYSEDDILFSKHNFKYWLNYKKICIKNNLNLGFLRTESKNKKIFSTDLINQINFKMMIEGKMFAVNNINNYCAFWIYDRKELNKFIKTNFWKFKWKGKNIHAFYGIREMSAVGWHGKNMFRYIATVIPLVNKKLHSSCFIKHLSNNHALSNHPVGFGSIEKNKILSKKMSDFSKIKNESLVIKFLKYTFRKVI
tara:strand:- start:944 stop:1786 length:843 start_codon:yes stop_codon:yes gene_type:complete